MGKVKHLLLCRPSWSYGEGPAIPVGHLGSLWRGVGKWKESRKKGRYKKESSIDKKFSETYITIL
jgi:hypothetical protein